MVLNSDRTFLLEDGVVTFISNEEQSVLVFRVLGFWFLVFFLYLGVLLKIII